MDVVASRDLAERFVAGGDALPGLVLLVRGEFGLAAELDAQGPRSTHDRSIAPNPS